MRTYPTLATHPITHLRLAALPPEQIKPEDAVVAEHHRVPRGRGELHPIPPLAGHPRRAALQRVATDATRAVVGREGSVPHPSVPLQERGQEPARVVKRWQQGGGGSIIMGVGVVGS